LKQLDPNFTDATIEKAKATTVEFIVDLYRGGLDRVKEPEKRGKDVPVAATTRRQQWLCLMMMTTTMRTTFSRIL
jgi:hypothetical protein